MASLKSLKMRNDEKERQIKCLIVEDYKTGDIVKYYDPKEFKNIVEQTDEMFLTKVYTPTQEEKDHLFKSLQEEIIVSDGMVEVKITEADIVMGLFKKFTDLEIDLNDKELIEEVMKNPSELFVAIKIEMDKILMSSLESYLSTYKTLKANPQAQELLEKSVELKLMTEEERLRKQKIEELKKQADETLAKLKELGVE